MVQRRFPGRGKMWGDAQVKKGEGEASNQSKRNEEGNRRSVNLKTHTRRGMGEQAWDREGTDHEWLSKKFELYFKTNEDIIEIS